MKHIDIQLPKGVDATTIVKLIDTAIQAAGLTTTMRNTLRKYPGCIHWNLVNDHKPGALELTYWPKEDRGWITIPDGPRAAWVPEKVEKISDFVKDRIKRQSGR